MLRSWAGIGRRARGARASTVLLCAAFTLLPVACAGRAQLRAGVVHDYPVYYVDAPPRIYRYPSAYYHGRPAYLVGNRWYYESPRGWVIFREEPRELRTYRERRIVSGARVRQREREERRARPHQRRRRTPYDARRDEPTQRRRRTVDPD
jgi:hypothetical protein